MPGVGPVTAIAVEAFGPDMAQFKTGRDFAAWQGRMTKTDQTDIRRFLIISAMSRLRWATSISHMQACVAGHWMERQI
ncbi:transposase [uncultured Ruegeria sp.]|uniref:transposase n=1 Tax=uncultured Ruegeria sp. TaxID=259304 RepID=UPI00345C0339